MSYATILQQAATVRLLPPGEDENEPLPDKSHYRWHRYSCNAVKYSTYPATNEAADCSNWYYYTILCADRIVFSAAMPDVPFEEQQNVRFMLLLFASYLAEDLGL